MGYRKARNSFKNRCRELDALCELCWEPIDYDAEPETPRSFTLDHIKPMHERPDLRLDRSNWQPAHWFCNQAKAAHAVPPGFFVARPRKPLTYNPFQEMSYAKVGSRDPSQAVVHHDVPA